MQVQTHKTRLLGYGPQEGRIGERMNSPPYHDFDVFLKAAQDSPISAHSLSLETKYDTPSMQVNPSDYQPDNNNMGTTALDDQIEMPDAEAEAVEGTIPTDGARHLQGDASDSAPEPQAEVDTTDDSAPSETDADVPTEGERGHAKQTGPVLDPPIEYITLRTK